MRDAILTKTCPVVILTSSARQAYVMEDEIVISRPVVIMGNALTLPYIDCAAAIRAFRVVAGGYLELQVRPPTHPPTLPPSPISTVLLPFAPSAWWPGASSNSRYLVYPPTHPPTHPPLYRLCCCHSRLPRGGRGLPQTPGTSSIHPPTHPPTHPLSSSCIYTFAVIQPTHPPTHPPTNSFLLFVRINMGKGFVHPPTHPPNPPTHPPTHLLSSSFASIWARASFVPGTASSASKRPAEGWRRRR